MKSLAKFFTSTRVLVTVVFAASCLNTATAQSEIKAEDFKSRVSIVTADSQTKIWITDFPKQTTVVVFDNEHNLLSIVTTNDFGAAFLNLSQTIKNTIYVKTVNGEIIVTNKPFIKDGSDGKVAGQVKPSIKA